MPNVSGSASTSVDELVLLIAGVFGRRLEVPDFGADDDFFGRGGSSFLAALCVAELKKAGLALAIQDVFLGKTPRAVAERIESLQKVG
ncbi:hypothetical protein GCM10009839_62470 [Catenulispora yoronensis]|uniref:Carrier domain-containing protein n=1 Tax=Catenulispora yoronensis TaxID=450799 RepID=A0ABN2V2K7_9ACTN